MCFSLADIANPAFDPRRGDIRDISNIVLSYTSWTVFDFTHAVNRMHIDMTDVRTRRDISDIMLPVDLLLTFCIAQSPGMIPYSAAPLRGDDDGSVLLKHLKYSRTSAAGYYHGENHDYSNVEPEYDILALLQQAPDHVWEDGYVSELAMVALFARYAPCTETDVNMTYLPRRYYGVVERAYLRHVCMCCHTFADAAMFLFDDVGSNDEIEEMDLECFEHLMQQLCLFNVPSTSELIEFVIHGDREPERLDVVLSILQRLPDWEMERFKVVTYYVQGAYDCPNPDDIINILQRPQMDAAGNVTGQPARMISVLRIVLAYAERYERPIREECMAPHLIDKFWKIEASLSVEEASEFKCLLEARRLDYAYVGRNEDLMSTRGVWVIQNVPWRAKR